MFRYIYLVRVSIDWHNKDTEDNTIAYVDENAALKQMKREVAKVKAEIVDRQEREIEWERENDRVYTAESSANDYISVWVEKVELHNKAEGAKR